MLVATSLAGPVLGILFLCINSMQALDDPLPSTILSVCRQGLLFIPLLYLLDALLGLTGVIYTQTAADYLSIVISLYEKAARVTKVRKKGICLFQGKESAKLVYESTKQIA